MPDEYLSDILKPSSPVFQRISGLFDAFKPFKASALTSIEGKEVPFYLGAKTTTVPSEYEVEFVKKLAPLLPSMDDSTASSKDGLRVSNDGLDPVQAWQLMRGFLTHNGTYLFSNASAMNDAFGDSWLQRAYDYVCDERIALLKILRNLHACASEDGHHQCKAASSCLQALDQLSGKQDVSVVLNDPSCHHFFGVAPPHHAWFFGCSHPHAHSSRPGSATTSRRCAWPSAPRPTSQQAYSPPRTGSSGMCAS